VACLADQAAFSASAVRRSQPVVSQSGPSFRFCRAERLRKLDHIRLSRDDMADALERYAAKTELKPFLRPEQIKQLLAACRAHDAD